jgi:5'-deoxynucleotidase YfbR-like HD superfamily hydrolase
MLAHITELRNGSSTLRWHTRRTIRQQTVADHSHGVALLVSELFPHASTNLYRAVLRHDLAEGFTGDIPATAKWANPELAHALQKVEVEWHTRTNTQILLTTGEACILKWCDMMELVLWCMEEASMGNAPMMDVARLGLNYLCKMGHPNKNAQQFAEEVGANINRTPVDQPPATMAAAHAGANSR